MATPESEQVLVSVVALDENALHLSLTLHGNLPPSEQFIHE